MKVIEFHGGLGNQLFEYVYLMYLKKQFPSEQFYTYINCNRLNLHNGFELSKWFDIDLPPTTKSITALCVLLFNTNRILRKLRLPLIGVSDDVHLNDMKLLHEGWYQNKRYFKEVGAPTFRKDLVLGKDNEELLHKIKSCNSVSIHIRRGDFLSPINSKAMGGICTPKYYEKAMIKIKELVPNPVFFFFSDDPEYVNKTYDDLEKYVVTCNQGERSFFDIYLMSHCQNMILANSTFSCWAAYLNNKAQNIICPPIWNRNEMPDLSLENWIVIDGAY